MASQTPTRVDLPVLPLRDVVVYPHLVIPQFVGRDKSIRALEQVMEGDKQILLIAQKSPDTDEPGATDLYEVGTLAQVLQLLKLPDGTVKVLVEGAARVRVSAFAERAGVMTAPGAVQEPAISNAPRRMGVTARALGARVGRTGRRPNGREASVGCSDQVTLVRAPRMRVCVGGQCTTP